MPGREAEAIREMPTVRETVPELYTNYSGRWTDTSCEAGRSGKEALQDGAESSIG